METREIETGMHELAEIFCDLSTLVSKQGQMIGEGCLISKRHAVDVPNPIIDNIGCMFLLEQHLTVICGLAQGQFPRYKYSVMGSHKKTKTKRNVD